MTELANFEFVVLLVVMRLGDAAYGVPIAKEIERATGRDPIVASVYAALARLEAKGLVDSELGDPTPERGGRAKKYFRATAKGMRAVSETKRTFVHLWRGLSLSQT